MSSNNNCAISIHLDSNDAVIAGEPVRGHLVVECTNEDTLKSLHIQIQGEEKISTKNSSYSSSNIFVLLNPPMEYNPKLQEGE